jgi:leader peptidase (prepilin peptidase)/N-methyltransferase
MSFAHVDLAKLIFSAIPFVAFAPFALHACIIDFREHRLPNKIVRRCTLSALTALAVCSLASNSASKFQQAVVTSMFAFFAFLFLHIISKRQLGLGDVKFAIPCGLIIGWYAPQSLFMWLWISFGCAAVVALFGIASHVLSRKQAIAFGPFMVFGLCLVIFSTLRVAN